VTPRAAPIARVPRSRRDDHYQAGRPTPIKRPSTGWVKSLQDDTVTVVILDEALTGVVFLHDKPTVGAICEVEARGDLLCILQWFEGAPPPPDVIHEDVYLTRGRVIANPPGTADDLDYFHNLPADGPVVFKTTTDGYGTYLYPVEYDGLPAWEFGFVPPTPDGYVLASVTPFIKAHTANGSQAPITVDTSSWGYHPPPTKSPYLLTNASQPLIFDTFPAGSDPADVILCGSARSGEQNQSALRSEKWNGTATTCDIVLSAYGWRYTFTPSP
jgi:hypothetical protein